MQHQQADYTVVAARPLAARPVDAANLPDDLRDRLLGHRHTRQQLEDLGVEFVGDVAILRHGGMEWRLDVTPAL